jgi:hypothetical protein
VVGLLLVLASTVAGASVLRAADDSTPVYVARHALVAGRALTSDDVSVARVRVAGGTQRYLGAEHRPDGALVVLRAVAEGELVPLSALGDARDVDLRPVAVPVDGAAAEQLKTGVLVDVRVASRSATRADGFERPRQVAAGVQVVTRSAPHSSWGVPASSTVQLLLTPQLVPVVIEAVDNDARITLVPVPASLPRAAEEGS